MTWPGHGLDEAMPSPFTGTRRNGGLARLVIVVNFYVLGPLDVEIDGVRIEFGRRRERCLLGVLLQIPP